MTFSTGTIGDLIDGGYNLRVHCAAGGGCYHHGPVNLEDLAAKIGRHHSSMAPDIQRYFRCSKCDSKRVGFILSMGGGGDLSKVQLHIQLTSLRSREGDPPPAPIGPRRHRRRR